MFQVSTIYIFWIQQKNVVQVWIKEEKLLFKCKD